MLEIKSELQQIKCGNWLSLLAFDIPAMVVRTMPRSVLKWHTMVPSQGGRGSALRLCARTIPSDKAPAVRRVAYDRQCRSVGLPFSKTVF
jgi:hypothetical protein